MALQQAPVSNGGPWEGVYLISDVRFAGMTRNSHKIR